MGVKRRNQKTIIQITIKLIELFLNPGMIPSQSDQMHLKTRLITMRSKPDYVEADLL